MIHCHGAPPGSPATSRDGPNERGELSESHIRHSGNVIADARLAPDPQQDGLAHLPGDEHHRPSPATARQARSSCTSSGRSRSRSRTSEG